MNRRAALILLVSLVLVVPSSAAFAGDQGGPPACSEADDGDNRHPSGKDRSCEAGGSGSQGGSESEPDGDGRGPDRLDRGVDKPGEGGGLDTADQDGNNGCGNDDDFEDDNEGWCGAKPKPPQAGQAGAQIALGIEGAQVLGAGAESREAVSGRVGEAVLGAGIETAVLGVKLESEAEVLGAGAILPRTGLAAASLGALGLDLLLLGVVLRRRARDPHPAAGRT